MKRWIIAIILMFTFCGNVLCDAPGNTVGQFFSLYRAKKFAAAARHLNITSRGSMEVKITENALSNMWYAFYDRDTKLENTREIIDMNREEVKGLEQELLLMEEEGVSRKEYNEMHSQLISMENDLRLLNALVDSSVDVSGSVITSQKVDNFAVVVVKAKLTFPSKYYTEIWNFVEDIKLLMPTAALKHVKMQRNSLTFPAVFYLIDVSAGWKLMLFSHDNFPEEMFEDVLADFDMSLGEFKWMAGSQAQIFWEEASLEVFNTNR